MPRDDFPAVSDGPTPAEPGAWEETLYELVEGKDWKKKQWGDEIGTVRLEQSDGGEGLEVTASFSFGQGRRVRYRGPVPGGRSWRGKSTLRHVDGDDRGKPTLEVECTNPKRWG